MLSLLHALMITIDTYRCQIPLKDLQLRRHYNLQLLLDLQSPSGQPSLYITLYLAKCPALEGKALQGMEEKQTTLVETRIASCSDISRYTCPDSFLSAFSFCNMRWKPSRLLPCSFDCNHSSSD